MVWTASRRTVALIAAIGVLLPSLAILQYQWLGELSGLEQMRARQNLEAATVRLSTEFDSRLAQIIRTWPPSICRGPMAPPRPCATAFAI